MWRKRNSSTVPFPLVRRSRKAILFLTIPFLWILHETLWQQGAAWQRRADEPRTQRANAEANLRSNHQSEESLPSRPIRMEDLADIRPVQSLYANHSLQGAVTWEEAIVGREAVVDVLTRAGLSIDLDVLKILPTWDTVTQLYGDEPVILGLERCEAFRQAHAPSQRFTGIAGLHNCGTNAMARYLKQNVQIPGNSRGGFMAHVPWHKHGG